MQQFSIRDIEQLCGIKAHTLRIWEQRYQLGVAGRNCGQHRIYNNEDLKQWLRIAYLYHRGYKISLIAGLAPEAMEKKLEAHFLEDNSDSAVIHQLTEASLDFNKEQFERIIHAAVLRSGITHGILHIFYPYLQRIGLLWLTDHAIPAQEHFASHIIRKKIIMATDGLLPPEPSATTILVFAPTGEFHEIPLLTANYFFRKAGLRTVYFGTNVSTESLRYYLERRPVQYLYTHVITCLSTASPEEYLAGLSSFFKGTLLSSGPVFGNMMTPGVSQVHLLAPVDLISFAEKLAAG